MKNKTELKIEIPNGYEIDSFDVEKGIIKFKESPKDITKRIKIFDDVLKYHNISSFDYNGTKDEVAYRKLKLIVSALNDGWIPDFSDNHAKYYPYFYVDEFSLSCVYNSFNSSDCSTYLCLKSEELAEHSVKYFEDVYKDYFLR